MSFKTLEQIQKLSTKELEISLVENQKAISILHELIESHQKIVNTIKPMVGHPCRQMQTETNELCINDYKEATEPYLEEIAKISAEIVKRKMKSISSPFELLGFSSYFLEFQTFFDSFQILLKYILPIFHIWKFAYLFFLVIYFGFKFYKIIFKVKNSKTLK